MKICGCGAEFEPRDEFDDYCSSCWGWLNIDTAWAEEYDDEHEDPNDPLYWDTH